jgi:hypothetical protein
MSIPVRNKDQTIRRPTRASFSGSLFMPLAFLVPATLVNFVSAHLQLRNTLDRAKAEMDAAAKTVQAEARSKAKTTAPKPETTLLKRSNTDGFFGRFEIRLVTLIGPSTLPCRPLPRQELSSPKWRSVRGGSRFGNK